MDDIEARLERIEQTLITIIDMLKPQQYITMPPMSAEKQQELIAEFRRTPAKLVEPWPSRQAEYANERGE